MRQPRMRMTGREAFLPNMKKPPPMGLVKNDDNRGPKSRAMGKILRGVFGGEGGGVYIGDVVTGGGWNMRREETTVKVWRPLEVDRLKLDGYWCDMQYGEIAFHQGIQLCTPGVGRSGFVRAA